MFWKYFRNIFGRIWNLALYVTVLSIFVWLAFSNQGSNPYLFKITGAAGILALTLHPIHYLLGHFASSIVGTIYMLVLGLYCLYLATTNITPPQYFLHYVLAGLSLIMGAFLYFYSFVYLHRKSIRTFAVIKNHYVFLASGSLLMLMNNYYYEYEDNSGNKHNKKIEVFFTFSKPYAVGEKVPIIYRPDRPEKHVFL